MNLCSALSTKQDATHCKGTVFILDLICLTHHLCVTTEKTRIIAIPGTMTQYPTVAIFITQKSVCIPPEIGGLLPSDL